MKRYILTFTSGFLTGAFIIGLTISIILSVTVFDRLEQVEVSVYNIAESTRFFNERSAQLNTAYVNLVHGINALNKEQEERIQDAIEYFAFFANKKEK